MANKIPRVPVREQDAKDDNGIVYALEDLKGKVYQYDMDGNLLTVFPRSRMLATTVDFLKESGQMFLIMTGPPLRCHPCRLPANANIVFALPL